MEGRFLPLLALPLRPTLAAAPLPPQVPACWLAWAPAGTWAERNSHLGQSVYASIGLCPGSQTLMDPEALSVLGELAEPDPAAPPLLSLLAVICPPLGLTSSPTAPPPPPAKATCLSASPQPAQRGSKHGVPRIWQCT